MSFREFDYGKYLIVRVKHDSDIINFLTDLAKENEITAATFTVIGALKKAKLGFYDQKKREYLENKLQAPQEIASCVGNISIREDKAFVHAHAVLADREGNTKAGHLLEGRVFAAEVHLTELKGEVVRKYDSVTGLSLWNI